MPERIDLAAIRRAVVLTLALFLFGCEARVETHSKPSTATADTPDTSDARGLKIGDCLESPWFVERWEKPMYRRIEEIGERSYRVSIAPHYRSALNWTLDFEEVKRWRKAVCP